MFKLVICEFCGKELKTQGKKYFRCCSIEQLIETHLKRPNNQNKATIKKRVVIHKQLEKQDLRKLEPFSNPTANNNMEDIKPEEIKKEVTQDDILPIEPKEPEETASVTEKEEVNECSNCGEQDFPDDAERCPKCDFEFE